jgi:hypothetical protein
MSLQKKVHAKAQSRQVTKAKNLRDLWNLWFSQDSYS